MQPHRGVLLLVLGILSLTICGLVGPFVWMMGWSDLARIDAGRMDPEGRGLAQAGMICGAIATLLMVPAALIGVFVFISALASP